MTGFVRRHWVMMAVFLVLFAGLGDAKCDDRRDDAEIRRLQENVARANERALDRAREANEARAVADSLRAISDRRADTATVYVTRWRARVDTVSVEDRPLIALADSTIRRCEWALSACQRTVTAMAAAVAAKDTALVALGVERDALDTYARELERRLEGGDPIWGTVVLTAGGGAIGYALDGPNGALVGAGIGLGTDVVWRGLKSLVGSLR